MRNLKHLAGRGLAALLLALLLGAGAAQAQLEAYVANFNSNTVSVIDTATNTVTDTIPVDRSPQYVAFTPDGAFAYVANTNGRTVSVIDRVTRTIIATVPEGGATTFPVVVRMSNDGAFVYVLLNEISGNSSVSVIDTATNTVVATIPVTGTLQSMTLNPSGTLLWVGDGAGRIILVDTATNTVTGTFSVGISVAEIAFTPDGAFAYMTQSRGNNVVQVDTASHAVVATFSPGRFTFGVAITPDGSFAYVANLLDNTVAVVDINNGNAIVATIPVGAFPAEIALTPDGAFAYVTNEGGNTTSVIDTATRTVVATVPVGSAPTGIAIKRVIEVPPVLTSDSAAVTVNEGQTAANTGTVKDGNREAVTLTASVGTVVNNGDGTWSWSFATSDGPAQSQTVTITGDDGHGGVSSTSFSLTVNNVAPTITSVSNNGPVITGNPATITVSATDPAGTNDPLAYQFDCDNNGVFEIGPQAGNSASCTFASAGSHTVAVRVTDGDGGAATGSTVVTVLVPPPNCSGAVASPGQFWPPNHQFVPVQISGVTNPGGGALTISVTSIFQDEPTDGLGDGNTCPDGTGVGTATANLRAERGTLGNGRVYTVSFTATGAGGSCQGSVTVCVPYSSNGSCGNGGALFNSGVCSAVSQPPAKALIRAAHKHKSLLCGSHLPTLDCDLFCDASLILCH